MILPQLRLIKQDDLGAVNMQMTTLKQELFETLKTSLRETLNGVTALIGGLKQHRQKTKKLRSAVSSLKQLQALDA